MVLVDGLRKAGTGAGLEGFARANGLELTSSVAAREYAGSPFRSGERIVLHSLRTRTVPILEVGDSWPRERRPVHVSDSGAVSAEMHRTRRGSCAWSCTPRSSRDPRDSR